VTALRLSAKNSYSARTLSCGVKLPFRILPRFSQNLGGGYHALRGQNFGSERWLRHVTAKRRRGENGETPVGTRGYRLVLRGRKM